MIRFFQKITKLEKLNEKKFYSDLVDWFDNDFIELNESDIDSDFYGKLSSIKPLKMLISKYSSQLNLEDQRFCMELCLWGLTVKNKLDRSEDQLSFKFTSFGIPNY